MDTLDLQDGEGWKPVVVGIRFSDDEKILIHFQIRAWGSHYLVTTGSFTFSDGSEVGEGFLDDDDIERARTAVYSHIADMIGEMILDDEYVPDLWN